MNPENLHRIIANILARFDTPPSTTVILDPECGGNRRIALFSTRLKSRETNYSWPDACIIHRNEVRAVIEIEQSGPVSAARVGGKLLPAALSSCLRCLSAGSDAIAMAQEVAFIQIVNTAELKPATRKLRQYENLQTDIRRLLPMGSISRYYLIVGTSDSFSPAAKNHDTLIDAVRSGLHD